ncbi:MAG TPA: hypothetical protein VMH39_02770 [Gemmatimonadaceae bacterium]|nr:hypothetical protein [Gemmatimonadaceae bacterium]
MLQPVRPGQVVSGFVNTVKSSVHPVKPPISPVALQTAEARAQSTLNRIKGSPIGHSPIVPVYEQYLALQHSRGADPDEWIADLDANAKDAIDKRRNVVAFLSNALNLFKGPDKLQSIRTDLLRPAAAGQLTSQQASDRLDIISGRPAGFPFLTWVESNLGPLTIGLSVQAEFDALFGFGVGQGISGLRHHCLCMFRNVDVGVGPSIELEGSVQLAASLGLPAGGVDFDVGGSISVACGASGKVSVSFEPSPHRPTLAEPYFMNYTFRGIAIALGAGEGVTGSAAFGATISNILVGVAS